MVIGFSVYVLVAWLYLFNLNYILTDSNYTQIYLFTSNKLLMIEGRLNLKICIATIDLLELAII